MDYRLQRLGQPGHRRKHGRPSLRFRNPRYHNPPAKKEIQIRPPTSPRYRCLLSSQRPNIFSPSPRNLRRPARRTFPLHFPRKILHRHLPRRHRPLHRRQIKHVPSFTPECSHLHQPPALPWHRLLQRQHLRRPSDRGYPMALPRPQRGTGTGRKRRWPNPGPTSKVGQPRPPISQPSHPARSQHAPILLPQPPNPLAARPQIHRHPRHPRRTGHRIPPLLSLPRLRPHHPTLVHHPPAHPEHLALFPPRLARQRARLDARRLRGLAAAAERADAWEG